ncbi:MAG: hypothetical protein ACW987_00010 [Candidatus Thorarchaeota archaeon]|jgi:hypothetical protein
MKHVLLVLMGLLISIPAEAQLRRRGEAPKVEQAKQVVQVVRHNHNGNGYRGWNWGGHGHNGWGRNHHASTAAEGYLSGLGDLYRGQGQFLMAKGRYFIDYERARRLYIDNWQHGVRTWWGVRDEYKERYRRDHPDYITRESHKLDMLEARHELEQRRNKLLKKGVIQPRPESAFFYKGEKFANYSEFKNSPKYAELKTDARMKHLMWNLERKAKEQQYEEALRFLAKWRGMGTVAQRNYINNRNVDAVLKKPPLGPPKYELKIKKVVPPHRR